MEINGVVFYSTKGLSTSELPQDDTFYIQEHLNADLLSSTFEYPGDEIIRQLINRCVELFDVFQDKIFPDRKEFNFYSSIVPIGISEGGLNSDCSISKMLFKRFFEDTGSADDGLPAKITTPEVDKHKFLYAYLVDCQSLISTLQELILSANDSFTGFYMLLSSVPDRSSFSETYYSINAEGRLAFNMLHSLIIQLYSTFDITTKIAYELENMKPCTSNYVRLASRDVLYGKRKKLKMDKVGTIFESNRQLSIVENLRNELVHNATWEVYPKVFFIKENGKLLERSIHLPDFTEEGNLVTYKNRKRFFADGKKVNEELPVIFLEVMNRLYETLIKLS